MALHLEWLTEFCQGVSPGLSLDVGLGLCHQGFNTFLQQKSEQMGNNLAEQQVNNNNKAKSKCQTQEQLSSPVSQVVKTYNFGNFENCELNTDINLRSLIEIWFS